MRLTRQVSNSAAHDIGLVGPDGPLGGVFLFTRGGRLAGLEVYSYTDPIARPPDPDSLVVLPPWADDVGWT